MTHWAGSSLLGRTMSFVGIMRAKLIIAYHSLSGWWLSLPLWKMMEFVSWDDYSKYLENHKNHVPNHQPGTNWPTKVCSFRVLNHVQLQFWCYIFWTIAILVGVLCAGIQRLHPVQIKSQNLRWTCFYLVYPPGVKHGLLEHTPSMDDFPS